MKVKVINKSPFDLPKYETSGSVGLDLRANISNKVYVQPHKSILIPTGLQVSIPEGFEGQVRSQRGLSVRRGLVAILGTLDQGYTDDIGVILHNNTDFVREVNKGDSIAQLVFAPVSRIEWDEVYN